MRFPTRRWWERELSASSAPGAFTVASARFRFCRCSSNEYTLIAVDTRFFVLSALHESSERTYEVILGSGVIIQPRSFF